MPAAGGALPAPDGGGEPAALRPPRGPSTTPRRRSSEMLDLTGLAERRDDQVAASPAATSSGSTSRSACSPSPSCCCSTSPASASTRASGRGSGSSSRGLAGGGTTVIFSTHNIQEAERYGQRLLVLADGERLFDGTAAELRAAVAQEAPEAASSDFETAFVAFLRHRGHSMRWLLLKDLQILRRSPLQAALLVIYPIADRAPGRLRDLARPREPRVAFLNEVPQGTRVERRRRGASTVHARDGSASRVECVDVDSASEARQRSRRRRPRRPDPARDLVDQVNSLDARSTPSQPTVEVIVNEEDPVKAQLVDDRISSLLTEANLLIAQRVAERRRVPRPDPQRRRLRASSARRSRCSGCETRREILRRCGRRCRREPRDAARPGDPLRRARPRQPRPRRAAARRRRRADPGRQGGDLRASPALDISRSPSRRR